MTESGTTPLLSIILDTEEGKEEREDISGHRTGIAEETLDRVSLCLLFSFTISPTSILNGCIAMLMLVSRNISAIRPKSIAPLTVSPSEPAFGSRHITRTAIVAPTKEIRDAATKAAPRLIAQRAHDRLNQDSHQRRENPEITQVVWVSTQRCKDSGDVGAL